MKLEDLIDAFENARKICPPDEYDFRQRNLLYVIAGYLIERDEIIAKKGKESK